MHSFILRLLVVLAAALALTGCPKEPLTVAYVVRHAEKAATPPDDPPLTGAGQARAESLADRLGTQPIVAVFSTDSTRTRDTAQPLADRLGLTVQLYTSTSDLAQLIKTAYAGKAVVVVGHSNTVPVLMSDLGGTPPADIAGGIPEEEFDNLYLVLISSTDAGVAALKY